MRPRTLALLAALTLAGCVTEVEHWCKVRRIWMTYDLETSVLTEDSITFEMHRGTCEVLGFSADTTTVQPQDIP